MIHGDADANRQSVLKSWMRHTTTEGEGSADDLTIANVITVGITLTAVELAFPIKYIFLGWHFRVEYDWFLVSTYNQNVRQSLFGIWSANRAGANQPIVFYDYKWY